jgi:hypothetical protein
MKKLSFLFLVFIIGCTPTSIDSLSKEAELFLKEVNTDYSHIICSKNGQWSANCTILNDRNQLLRIYCSESGGCQFRKCNSEYCIRKSKIEKIEVPYVIVDEE